MEKDKKYPNQLSEKPENKNSGENSVRHNRIAERMKSYQKGLRTVLDGLEKAMPLPAPIEVFKDEQEGKKNNES